MTKYHNFVQFSKHFIEYPKLNQYYKYQENQSYQYQENECYQSQENQYQENQYYQSQENQENEGGVGAGQGKAINRLSLVFISLFLIQLDFPILLMQCSIILVHQYFLFIVANNFNLNDCN